MKKIKFILAFLLFSIGMLAQTNPYILPRDAVNQVSKYRGGVALDSIFKMPVRSQAALYPDLPMLGRMQLNEITNNPEYFNGITWVTMKDYVTPEMFGAIGDGVADDTDEINAAMTASNNVFAPNRYLVSSTINVNSNKTLFGIGDSSRLITTSNIDIVEFKGVRSHVRDITFIGSGKDSGLTAQNGIRMDGDGNNNTPREGNKISFCNFIDLGGSGYYTTLTRGLNFTGGCSLTTCFATSCNRGFFSDVRGEYSTFSNCYAINCNDGLKIIGGNVSWIGGQLQFNGNNFVLAQGDNDAHCTITGCKMNHAVNYSLYATGIDNGYRIINCDLYAAAIYIDDCAALRFDDCDFGFNATGNVLKPLTVTNSTVRFQNSRFTTNPSAFTSTGSTIEWLENTFDLGLTGSLSGITNLKLQDKQATLVSGTNIKTVGGSSLLGSGDVPFPTVDATPTDGSSNAVSSNGTFDALALKQATLVSATNIKTIDSQTILGSGNLKIGVKTLFADTVDSSTVTGTTSETILQSYLIPANSIGVGTLSFENLFSKTGTAGTCTYNVKINTSNSLSGATTIATSGSVTATDLSKVMVRKGYLKTGNTMVIYPASSGISVPAQSSLAPSSVTFDPTVDNYIIVSVTLANAADSAKQAGFEMTFRN